MRNRDKVLWLTFSFVALLAIAALVKPHGLLGGSVTFDAEQYLDMAEFGPFQNSVHTHQRTRVLTPTIVWMLPMPKELGFEIVTLVSLALLGAAVYRVVRVLDLSASHACIAVVILSTLFYPTVYYARNPFSVDPLFLLLWTLCLLFALEERLLMLGVAIAVGALAKEATFFLALMCLYLWTARLSLVQSAVRVFIVFLPATLLNLWVRSAVAPTTLYAFVVGQVDPVVNSIRDGSSLRGAVSGFILSGGVMWVAALLGWRMAQPRHRRVFLSGVLATIPILITATAQDAGRYLTGFIPFWMPLVIATWLPAGRTESRDPHLLLAAVVAGNALLAAAVLLELSIVGEVGLRACGLGLQLLPAAGVLRRWRAANTPA